MEQLVVKLLEVVGPKPPQSDPTKRWEDVAFDVAPVAVVGAFGEYDALGRQPPRGEVRPQGESAHLVVAALQDRGEVSSEAFSICTIRPGRVPLPPLAPRRRIDAFVDHGVPAIALACHVALHRLLLLPAHAGREPGRRIGRRPGMWVIPPCGTTKTSDRGRLHQSELSVEVAASCVDRSQLRRRSGRFGRSDAEDLDGHVAIDPIGHGNEDVGPPPAGDQGIDLVVIQEHVSGRDQDGPTVDIPTPRRTPAAAVPAVPGQREDSCPGDDAAVRPSNPWWRREPSIASATDKTSKRKVLSVPGKFVIKKGTTGKFRFNLLASNGQVVATSEAYGSKAAAMGGVRSVQKLAADATIEDQTTKEWSDAEAARKATASAKKVAAAAKPKAARKSVTRKTG
ncbi:MAG: YegP family protein [Actinomycetota bacterium]|nr:YegP family protein [Actinomycetota bacterium]